MTILKPTPQGSAAARRAGQSQTERDDWPWSYFRRLDRAVGDMLAECPTLDARRALLAVLEDDPELAEGYRTAMRWLGSGANFHDKAERASLFSEAVAEMRPTLRHFIQGRTR